MTLVKNELVLNTEVLKETVESNILALINFVYLRSQERFDKLSKKGKRVIESLHGGDFTEDDICDELIGNITDYEIEPFNTVLEDMKTKDLAYIVGLADGILLTIKMFDVKINTRAYNLLRYLVTECK